MNFEKFDSGIEKSDIGKIETNTSQFEKNIEVEKPDSVLVKESAEDFIKELESEEYFSTYKERLDKTPTDRVGTWDGERGESKFIPNDEKAQETIQKYGKDGVEYANAIPNFSPFAEAEVQIPNMTDDRDGTDGNFDQANEVCSQKWNEIQKDGRTDWTPDKVEEWRKENKYSWHECNDMKTCQLVPREIHENCKHLGGVAECKRMMKSEEA